MKIALIQLNPIIGDIEGNSRKIIEAIQNAVKQNPSIDIVVTPELSLIGYPPKDILLFDGFVERCEESLRALAVAIGDFYQGVVLVGTITKNLLGGKPLYNSAAVLVQGKIQQRFHKTLLPTYDVFDEDRYFESKPMGEKNILVVGDSTVGITICEDLWFQNSNNRYHVNPIAEVMAYKPYGIINMSASPFVIGKQNIKEDMVRAIVSKYHVPVIYCNQAGGQDDIVFDGNSFIMEADRDICTKAMSFSEDTVIGDMVNKCHVDFSHNEREEHDAFYALVCGVKDYVHKNGFERAVIGLSGGIDSALTAVIACHALGNNNVHGILMPSPYSSQGSIDDSLDLVSNLKIGKTIIPIEPMMKAFDSVFANNILPGWSNPTQVAEENIQARIRGTILMAFSNKTPKQMVLSTGNKSEMSVGYTTLYGDSVGGLDVLSDVPKVMVYSIAKWYNDVFSEKVVIPQNTIDKAPSAELRPDQKDSDSLPDYPVLDTILKKYIEKRKSASTIQAETTYPMEVIEKVLSMVTLAEYKRKQVPPGIKITDTAFGVGWRMPTACKFKR